MLVVHLITDGPYILAGQIVVEGHHPVDDTAWSKFDNPVGNGMDELMVVACEKEDFGELNQAVVQGGDGFEVEVIGRFIEDQNICAAEHHLTEHTTHLFPSGKHLNRFHGLIARKEHTTEKASDPRLIVAFGKLPEPVGEVHLIFKKGDIILWKVTWGDGYPPIIASRVGICFSAENIEKGGLCLVHRADKGNLISSVNGKIEILEQLLSLKGGRKPLHFKDIFSALPLRLKTDIGETAARWFDVVNGQLFEKFFLLVACRALLALDENAE